MSALLPSDEEVEAACVAFAKSSAANWPIASGTSAGQSDIAQYASDLFRSRMRDALVAAWNRRTAPVGASSGFALAQLRHAYAHLVNGTVGPDHKRFADGLIAPAIRELEAPAPTAPSREDVARVIAPWAFEASALHDARAHDVRDSALARAAAILSLLGQTGDGWLPIESAPKDGTPGDLWVVWPEHDKSRREPDAFWNSDASEWQFGEFHAGQFVHRPVPTHWRPLPAPPAKEGR